MSQVWSWATSNLTRRLSSDGKFFSNKKSHRLITRQENKSFDLSEKAHIRRAKIRNRDLIGVVDAGYIKDVNVKLNPSNNKVDLKSNKNKYRKIIRKKFQTF